jgi:hypothetical protein
MMGDLAEKDPFQPPTLNSGKPTKEALPKPDSKKVFGHTLRAGL